MYDVYAGLLKMNEEFKEPTQHNEDIHYELDGDYQNIATLYQLKEVAGNGDDYSKIKNLLNWETKHIQHKGDYDGHVKNTALDLFQYSFDTTEGINCRSLSIALMECLMSIQIKARVLYMFPYTPYDSDNHVICEAWVNDLKKWIMIDPTFNGIVLDESNRPLNVMEIRQAIANREKLHFEDGLNYNGNATDENEIFEYYAKDMFWFTMKDCQGCGNENRSNVHTISIVPKGYDIHKSQLLNVDYRISCWGDNESLNEWKKQIGNDTPIYKTLFSLYE